MSSVAAPREPALSSEGFLVHPADWSEDVARWLARTALGVDELTDEHWAVIRCIRAHFVAHRRAPMVRGLCAATGLRLKRIYELFPGGPARGACRVAGLPTPEGCV